MTKAQMERIVQGWLPRLGLDRWKVEFKWAEPCDAENYAEVEKSSFYDSAKIRLEPDWAKWSPEFAEVTLVHELVHLLHRDVDQAFNDIDGQLQRDAWIMAERRYRHAMEGFVDRLATRLVELSP